MAAWGQGTSMGQGELPRARAWPHVPVMSPPRVSRGSQGLCATPALALPPPPRSPCKAEHWDGQNSPGGPRTGQDTWHRLGVPGSPGCSTFCGLRGDRDVCEQPHHGLGCPCKHCWSWHSPGDALGLIWQGHLGKKLFASLSWVELHLRAGEKQFHPRARVI